MGTTLEAQGLSLEGPQWSLEALRRPDAVAAVHRAHVQAGAEAVTTATFRLHAAAEEDQADLARQAVRLARRADPKWVVGGLGPVADCYRPEATPPDPVLRRRHRSASEALVDAGVDALLLETMNSPREAAVAAGAADAARPQGMAMLVAFVVARGRVLDGSTMAEAVRAVAPARPDALLIDCSGLPATQQALPALREAWGGPWGAYPNRSTGDPRAGFRDGHGVDASALAAAAARWRDQGAAVLGTCCGFPPAFTAVLAGLRGGARGAP